LAPKEITNKQEVRPQVEGILKRSGNVAPFQKKKITTAIWKAIRSVNEADYSKAIEVSNKVVLEVNKRWGHSEIIPTVEEVQDIVEKQLILSRLPETAKAYILYRDLHNRMRNINNLLDIAAKINSYINKDDWKVHSDSEIDYHLQGLYKKIVDEVSERYWMNEVYTPLMRELHENEDFHIHKCSALSSYCVGWDIQDLLMVGFTGVPGNVSSAPAKHMRSALGQLMNFFYTLTNEAPDGAVAVSSLDTYLAPFIAYDKLDYKHVKQNLQEFIFNMNMPTKSGGQVVFSNVTLDLKCPPSMKDQPVIIGGKLMDKKYGDFQEEMDMFNQALAEVYAEGDAKGRAFSWPIPTYNITKDFDWDNPAYDNIWEMTAKYGIPYFANFVNSDMDPDDARSMCCRLRLDKRELRKRGGGLFGAYPLTGSIGYVTINLPRLGYLYKGDKKQFFDRLGFLMDVSSENLQIKRKVIEEFTEKGLYPYSKFYLRNIKEKSGHYWSNHFNTIGLVGMNEACLNYLGKPIESKEGHKFALEVLDFMNKKLLEYQDKTGQMYNLEASPAEGTSYSLARKDKMLYPDIIVANEAEVKQGAEPFYTNSSQLAVDFTGDLFEALDLQDDIQCKYTGGTVFHAFIGERLASGKEAKELIKKISSNYKLPYFTITPTFSICESHGYINGEHFKCPKCDSECKVYSRVVGKIAPVQRWNPGKKAEFSIRDEFCVS